VVAALKARQPKTGAKRGRKRIEDVQDVKGKLEEHSGIA
jgi:hypothetical protein